MKFVDEVTVEVQAGNGGNGCMSFLRRANVPKGGPDGGNGGQGGSVFLVGDSALNTLVDLRYKPLVKAQNGRPGSSSLKQGAAGDTTRIPVPCGTTVIDDETMEVLGDIKDADQTLCVAHGGDPGRGNASFKSSRNRAPRETTSGMKGEGRRLRLQLRVLADVGLLGLPNAGKSTLLSSVSASRPKIAEYQFTTLIPNLGVVEPDSDRSFVMADIPGLIQGAANGVGLGTRFLRHLSRTSFILHLVECCPLDESDPVSNLVEIEKELKIYSDALGELPIWTVVTKTDIAQPDMIEQLVSALEKVHPNRPVFAISAVTNSGVNELVDKLSEKINERRAAKEAEAESFELTDEQDQRIADDVLQRSLIERRRLLEKQSQPDDDEPEVIYVND